MSVRSDPVRLSRTSDGRSIEATVSRVGAGLQALSVDGLDLVAGGLEGPVAYSGAVLVPWPNRIRRATWTLDGATQSLDVTESTGGNALHGLVATTPFEVIEHDQDVVGLAASVDSPAGYPFELDVEVRYHLIPTGIRSEITVVNRSDRPAPVAVGVHPYLRVGDAPSTDLRIQVAAETTLVLGDDNLPRASEPVAGTPYDLRTPTVLEDAPGHAAYTGLHSEAGRIRMRLCDDRTGESATLWADERFRWAQVYVTDRPPGRGPGAPAVALEPMTGPPDAFNSGVDVHWMPPASRWTLEWGIDRRRFRP
ncbi:aldose epimerase [Leifsonia sp. NPDC102414]|uniref:aldose epimerase family protein n=1 Tax=Leifsonia sp. NPDC102414 TaxID=3364124 RepID=UPI00381D0573